MKLLIIGCGYIGTGLALFWYNKGHTLTGITHSPKKLKVLNKILNKCIISDAKDENELLVFLKNNEAVVVTLSTDQTSEIEDSYLNTARALKQAATRLNTPKTLIYLSSSALYGDHKGQWVDERSELKTSSDSAKILIETEKVFLSLADLGWTVCVLRVSEIYGTGRELSSQIKELLEGENVPKSWDNYTNMIHQEDVMEAIDYALTHKLEGIYNLTDNDHPTRHELYDKICSQLHLPKIEWENLVAKQEKSANKRVSNYKIKAAGYVFRYPNRVLT